MSWIAASDPLALLALQTVVGSPATEGAAVGTSQLDRPQTAAVLGEPVPVVFARRRGQEGGVLISPRATEARFENSTTNEITAQYHLVLSEGLIAPIERRDIYQGQCRVGSYTQSYNRRAGTWDPGNFMVDRNTPYRRFFRLYSAWTIDTQEDAERFNAYNDIQVITSPDQLDEYPFEIFTWYEAELVNSSDPESYGSWNYRINGVDQDVGGVRSILATNYKIPVAPNYCGTVGRYPGISTLSYGITVPDGDDSWRKQVHAFIRNGMPVQRLYDNVFGPSDNFCDLIQWALTNTERVPADLIDVPALTTSAAFLERYALRCNGEFKDSSNVPDLIAQWARYFLLRETNANGKKGLRPALPVTAAGELITDPITPVYTFTDDVIMPGSFEANYSPLADRLPFVAQVMWRQHPDGHDVDTVRTAGVRFAGQALEGPYESHDLSQICTSELHAVRVGAYIISRRVRSTHSARLIAKPQIHNQLLNQGDVVRVRIRRETQGSPVSFHDWLYQVERISKTLAGEVSYELVHFPVDSQGRSLITQDVLAAQPTGIILPNNRTGPSCDLYGDDDRTLPEDTGRLGDGSPGVGIPFGGGAGPSDEPIVLDDGLDEPTPELERFPAGDGPLQPGDALVMPEEGLCGPGIEPEWRWFRFDEEVPGEKERYSVIWFAEVEPGVFEPLRGEYRCPGGEWTQFGLAPPPLAPLPAGREVQFYWNVSIRRYGFIGPVGGWRDTGVSLRVETVSEFIDYLGQPSTQDNIYEVDANGNETLVTSGSNARVWIEKSRYRDNGGPWQDLYDYSQFR